MKIATEIVLLALHEMENTEINISEENKIFIFQRNKI